MKVSILTVLALVASPEDRVIARIDGAPPDGAVHLAGPYYRLYGDVRVLRQDAAVRWAHRDAWRRISLDQDPLRYLQWHLHNDGSLSGTWPEIVAGADANVTPAWALALGDPGVVIAVLDTGFPSNHPDLPATARLGGWDFVDDDGDPSPPGVASLDAHGTAVAGLALGAMNDQGIVGVCPLCTLRPIRVLATNSLARDGDLTASIAWAAERADVIIASWSFDPATYVSQAFHDAVRWAATNGRGGRGTVVVFSAGNRSQLIEPFSPQAMVETIAVGSTDERDLRAAYSNRGPHLTLMAPGGVQDQFVMGTRLPRAKLVTADLIGDAGNNPTRDDTMAPGVVSDLAVTATFFGTSGSAPIVGGAAGLLIAINPNLTAGEVGWILTETADKVGGAGYANAGHDDDYGYGRVNVAAAADMADLGNHCNEAPEICTGGADEDCDRLIDGADPDCGAAIPQPFTVDLRQSCADSSECDDGFCTSAEGSGSVRTCSARCDFDCPSDGACVGRVGAARCHPVCATAADCPAGYGCGVPDVGIVPPGQAAVAVCAALCVDDSQCVSAVCRDGLCVGADPELEPPALLPPDEGCECGAVGQPILPLLAIVWVKRRRRD